MPQYLTRRRTVAYAEFLGADGKPADPTTVTLAVTSPQGTMLLTYGVDVALERSATGKYRYEHTPPAGEGPWTYDWLGEGAIDCPASIGVWMSDR